MPKNMTYWIIAGGEVPDPDRLARTIPDGVYMIAADSGLRWCHLMNRPPQLVVGDMDSAAQEDLEWIANQNVFVIRHSPQKDYSDLAIALMHTRMEDTAAVRIAGALGGRLDHTLGNLALLADPKNTGIDIRLDDGIVEIVSIERSIQLDGNPGDLLSLVPAGVDCEGVETTGLEYPLKQETLYHHLSRGISNVFTAPQISVSITTGRLLCVHTRL